jgi:hypothetical protein
MTPAACIVAVLAAAAMLLASVVSGWLAVVHVDRGDVHAAIAFVAATGALHLAAAVAIAAVWS